VKDAVQILRFLLDADSRGEHVALITITGVFGGSPREPGAHMAVSESGAFLGALSGGCVEAAIIGEAKRVIESGWAEGLRLGEGSPLIDIRLPCGGGMDILIAPVRDIRTLKQAATWLTARRPIVLLLGQHGDVTARLARPDDLTGWHAARFLARHEPDMRLVIAGHGAEMLALTKLGLSYGAEILLLSPDQAMVDTATGLGAQAQKLLSRHHAPQFSIDPQTAVVLLFHDHDWEDALLAHALAQPGFFVGAMGSRTTHARRLRRLAKNGVPEPARSRLVGPIGLITRARDPDTLALSALAQIVSLYGQSAAQKLTARPTPFSIMPS
jgi:xanthine dehydrogenase accessory factor